tara:strand:+ start:530 stop:661 length:132 start_codon:yes stop_codon:yes gene_type:complete
MIMGFDDIGYEPELREFVYINDIMYVVVEIDAPNQIFRLEFIG